MGFPPASSTMLSASQERSCGVTDSGTLVVIAYPDDSVAQAVIGTLERFSIENLISLDDTVYATCELDGEIKLHRVGYLSGASTKRQGHWPFSRKHDQQADL